MRRATAAGITPAAAVIGRFVILGPIVASFLPFLSV